MAFGNELVNQDGEKKEEEKKSEDQKGTAEGETVKKEHRKHRHKHRHEKKEPAKDVRKENIEEEEKRKQAEEEQRLKEEESLAREEDLKAKVTDTLTGVTGKLNLEGMEMEGEIPKKLPDMVNHREVTIEINEIGNERRSLGEPIGQAAKEKRQETEEMIRGMVEQAKEYERRYQAYVTDPRHPEHAKEAETRRKKTFERAGQRAEYLAKKREFQKTEAKAAKGSLRPTSQFMRLLLAVHRLSTMNSAAATVAQQEADRADRGDTWEERADTGLTILDNAGGLSGTFTSDMNDYIAEMSNKPNDWEMFKDIKFMSLVAPLIDTAGLIKEIVSLTRHSKHMSQEEYERAVVDILRGSTLSLLLDGLSSFLEIVGALDTVPIIGTIIGLLKSMVSFCNLALNYSEKKANLKGMQRRREMLSAKIIEQKRKLEYNGEDTIAKDVIARGSVKANSVKTSVVRHAKKLETEAGITTGADANERRQVWKNNKDQDETAKRNYYRVKMASLYKEYSMTADGEKKAKDEMWDIGVDSVREGVNVASTIAKAFPGYGTATGMVLDGVSIGIGLGNYLGKKLSQYWTDTYHADSDSSTQSTEERTNVYADSMMRDLLYLDTKIDAVKGKYIGSEAEESYVMGRIASINGILSNLSCPLSKLISAKNIKQMHNYIAAAFTA